MLLGTVPCDFKDFRWQLATNIRMMDAFRQAQVILMETIWHPMTLFCLQELCSWPTLQAQNLSCEFCPVGDSEWKGFPSNLAPVIESPGAIFSPLGEINRKSVTQRVHLLRHFPSLSICAWFLARRLSLPQAASQTNFTQYFRYVHTTLAGGGQAVSIW